MADRDDDFFIGWAGPSRRSLAFLVVVSVGLIGLFAGAAATVTQLQSSPGASERKTSEYVGIFHTEPYPHLVVPTEDGAATVLMSSGNKAGIQGSFLGKQDQVVKAKGFGMNRDGRRFLELWGGLQDAELPDDQLATVQAAEWEDLGPIELSGEIVDSKCYYGRMRPGSGKAHRACAQLCVRGGVPPVLVTHAPDGKRSHVLVVGPDRSDVHEEILDWIAEPVEVAGKLWRRGDLFAIELGTEDPGTSITRLWPEMR
ncbi:MAG: hypothetical protein AAF211_03585 [Myxococcota bacterium]